MANPVGGVHFDPQPRGVLKEGIVNVDDDAGGVDEGCRHRQSVKHVGLDTIA
jgi:hypothetical protein